MSRVRFLTPKKLFGRNHCRETFISVPGAIRVVDFNMNSLAPTAQSSPSFFSLRPRPIVDLELESSRVARLRCGRIEVTDGRLVAVHPRRMVAAASVAGVWWDIFAGRGDHQRCEIDFHVPRGMPAFVTLDYIRAGRRAGYANFRRAVRTLEQIAIIKGSHAIVAHVTNPMITDRLLTRLGWQEHCLNWRGRHWIRRFEAPSAGL